MKLDKIRFASLVGFLSCRYALTFTQDDIREVDELIEFEVEQPKAGVVPCGLVDELLRRMAEGTHKIEAIKAYRVLTGASLKESKDAVEKYWVSKPVDIAKAIKEVEF
jgi:ribosomal protein L7/L12